MSFTESVAFALFDWHCSTSRLPLIKQSMEVVHGSLSLRGRRSIDRLPNELLSAIFIFAIDQHCHDESDPSTTSPTTISQICHRWRQVALSIGGLWTNIVLTFPTSNGQLTRTLNWLERSKTSPLDILLDLRDPAWDWDEDTHGFRWADMKAVLTLLLPCASRWRTVELLTDTWAPIFAFLVHTRPVGPSLNRLEKLHLARCNAYFAAKGELFAPAALSQHLPLFGGDEAVVPRLREVTLTGVHIDWSASPLANLTKLELKYHAADVMPSVAQFAQILATCPDLEVLAIVGRGPQFAASNGIIGGTASSVVHGGSSQPDSGTGSMKLARVTQFSFGFVDINYAVQLLSLFDLPALRELNLEDVSASLLFQPPDDAAPLLEWLAAATHDANDTAFPLPDANATSTSNPISGSIESPSTSRLPMILLETLSLHSIHAPRSTFARFFGACAGLHVLRLCEVNAEALVALEGGSAAAKHRKNSVASAAPLPQLHTISARGVDESLLTRVVQGRGVQLKSFDCEGDSGPESDADDDC
ncbi:hypothetical protein DFH07DRAFT_930570 [Mycena maculata]|uniref:F-box domain-containing protein n=1 Tax=Mycena maculata TaxID=230809 RepID=A0AAD7HTX8_9AGAR|nr:hypothetical protein DFH07DRAFT_930570 [Mycena maculata]